MATNPMHQFQVYKLGPEIKLGNFDLSFNPAQTSQETPFEVVGTDAFGVATDSTVFSCSDPSGSLSTVDLGAFS